MQRPNRNYYSSDAFTLTGDETSFYYTLTLLLFSSKFHLHWNQNQAHIYSISFHSHFYFYGRINEILNTRIERGRVYAYVCMEKVPDGSIFVCRRLSCMHFSPVDIHKDRIKSRQPRFNKQKGSWIIRYLNGHSLTTTAAINPKMSLLKGVRKHWTLKLTMIKQIINVARTFVRVTRRQYVSCFICCLSLL